MTRPRVVLLHAFPLDCRMWAQTKHALVDAGWSVYAPDLPGPTADASIAAWAERILGATDGPLVPVGASMGGYVALELWRQAPERIAGLALVGSRSDADSPEARAARDETVELLGDVGLAALWERLAPKLFSAAAPEDVVDRARELALEQGAERLQAAVRAMRDRPDSTPLLPEIGVPALVVVGDEDGLVPPERGEAMAEALPKARLVRVAGAGHLPALERPEDVARELIAFLDELA